MIFGLENDDRYRMVEDEFLHTAQKFTAHLHRAEYNRLKTLAKSQNAETIREIERPVVAAHSMPWLTKRRQLEASKAKKQRGVPGAGSANERLPTGLSSLLESPRKERTGKIRSYAAEVPNTRAAAGFRERATDGERHRGGGGGRLTSRSGPTQPEIIADFSTEDEDDDDLTVSRPERRSTVQKKQAQKDKDSRSRTWPTASSSARLKTTQKPIQPTADPSKGKSRPSTNSATVAASESVDDDDFDDDDPFGIKKRKMDRIKSMEKGRRQG